MNQPAFPLAVEGEFINMGLSMRDYFAAQALQALIIREGKDALYINEITTTAYQYADDMLQEREA